MNGRVCFKGKRSLIERGAFSAVHADFVYSVDNKSGTSSNIWHECFSSVGGDTGQSFRRQLVVQFLKSSISRRSTFYSRFTASMQFVRSLIAFDISS